MWVVAEENNKCNIISLLEGASRRADQHEYARTQKSENLAI